jgi:hypothetical protein
MLSASGGAMTKKQDYPPYFRVWVDKFLTDHHHVDLDAPEFGVLVVLQCLAWRTKKCALPNDITFLKKAVRARLPGTHGNQINRLVPLVLERHFVLGRDCLYRNSYIADERKDVETGRKTKGNGKEKFPKPLKNNNGTSADTDTETKARFQSRVPKGNAAPENEVLGTEWWNAQDRQRELNGLIADLGDRIAGSCGTKKEELERERKELMDEREDLQLKHPSF